MNPNTKKPTRDIQSNLMQFAFTARLVTVKRLVWLDRYRRPGKHGLSGSPRRVTCPNRTVDDQEPDCSPLLAIWNTGDLSDCLLSHRTTAAGGTDMRIAESADVDPRAEVGEGTKIWHLAQIRENAQVGANCVIGRGAYIGSGVVLGDNCKVQNLALVYEPAMLGDGVFVGPAVVFTNDHFPRAVSPDGSLKSAADWEPVGVTVERGASIGARAVCVAPVTIGAWALVAAGSVVTKDVPPHALVAGVPARRIDWVGKTGKRLAKDTDGTLTCADTGERYNIVDDQLVPLT